MAKNSQNLQNRVAVAAVLYTMVVTTGSMVASRMPQATGALDLILRTLVLGVIFGGVGATIWYFALKGK